MLLSHFRLSLISDLAVLYYLLFLFSASAYLHTPLLLLLLLLLPRRSSHQPTPPPAALSELASLGFLQEMSWGGAHAQHLNLNTLPYNKQRAEDSSRQLKAPK